MTTYTDSSCSLGRTEALDEAVLIVRRATQQEVGFHFPPGNRSEFELQPSAWASEGRLQISTRLFREPWDLESAITNSNPLEDWCPQIYVFLKSPLLYNTLHVPFRTVKMCFKPNEVLLKWVKVEDAAAICALPAPTNRNVLMDNLL